MAENSILSNRNYDRMKYGVQIVLPASGTLYFTLGQLWGFPNIEEVVGTLAAVATFLGMILRISTKQYEGSDAPYDGYIDVEEEDGVKRFSLVLDADPENLDQKSSVNFKMRGKNVS